MTGEQFRTVFDSAPKCVIWTHARSEKKIALWIRMLMIGFLKDMGPELILERVVIFRQRKRQGREHFRLKQGVMSKGKVMRQCFCLEIMRSGDA